MPQSSYIFANARVKVLENQLLTSEKFNRMIDSLNAEDALKILYESSYGQGVDIESVYEFEKLLILESEKMALFLEAMSPDINATKCFLTKFDYHNAKALTKAKYLRLSDASFMCYSNGQIEIAKLRDWINADDYSSLPKPMADAIHQIDVFFASEKRNSKYIDTLLDKAMYRDIFEILKKCKSDLVVDYFKTEADLINILTASRFKISNIPSKDYAEQFIDNGSVSLPMLVSFIDAPEIGAKETFKQTKYKELVLSIIEKIIKEENLAEIEKNIDNYLFNIFFKNKNDFFGLAPLISYYIAKQNEIKNIRIIMVGLINKADRPEIRLRMRQVYE